LSPALKGAVAGGAEIYYMESEKIKTYKAKKKKKKCLLAGTSTEYYWEI
jgi:hypothetical protein